MTVPRVPALAFVATLTMIALVPESSAKDSPKGPKPPPSVEEMREGLGPMFDTAADPPPRRGGYKVGQRVVHTIWLDNDDPSDGMRDIFIWMDRLPDHMRLDLSPDQPAYGNIFYDSGIPQFADTPANCRLYYISKLEGDTRVLTPGTDSSAIRDVVWVIRRGNSEQVVSPHNANENIYAGTKANLTYGAAVDEDELYVRYAVIVVDKPAKPKRVDKRTR